jgi:NAD+ synthase (glutamine-hydrolysing)
MPKAAVPLRPFRSLYRHGFFRVAIATPIVSLASPADNAAEMLRLANEAAKRHAGLVLFPELGITGYTNDDLFFQDALLDGAQSALSEILAASRQLLSIIVVGAPIRAEAKVFNCAILIHGGTIHGVVPKSFLPNYREFYEKRQFCPAVAAQLPSLNLLGQQVPFGADLIFEVKTCPGFALHVEVCEDLWAPISPSSYAALAGATVRQSLREQCDHRQSRVPTPALRLPIGAMCGRLPLCRRRLRRIDHRSCLGWSGTCLREW